LDLGRKHSLRKFQELVELNWLHWSEVGVLGSKDMVLSHRIALNPTPKQIIALYKAAGCTRFAYNWGLVEWERQYKEGLKPTWRSVQKSFNAIKGEKFPWVYDSPKDANQRAFRNLGQAFQRWFNWLSSGKKGKRVGYPTFKVKGSRDSFYLSNTVFRIDRHTKQVRLPIIGRVKTHQVLRFEGKIISATVSRDADRWYISVHVDVKDTLAIVPSLKSTKIVGIDLNLDRIVSSKGIVWNTPRPLKYYQEDLRRANRAVHRKKKGSSNRKKAAMKLATIHRKVANIRKDFLHKVTTQLCRENQTVVIEDLNVQGLCKNPYLAQSVYDLAPSKFKGLMEYKGIRYQCNVLKASTWFPSSKRCSNCGNLHEHLTLKDRVYECSQCGVTIDRDLNAALNLELYPCIRGNITPVEIEPILHKETFAASLVVEAGIDYTERLNRI
jgi:putative transposase